MITDHESRIKTKRDIQGKLRSGDGRKEEKSTHDWAFLVEPAFPPADLPPVMMKFWGMN